MGSLRLNSISQKPTSQTTIAYDNSEQPSRHNAKDTKRRPQAPTCPHGQLSCHYGRLLAEVSEPAELSRIRSWRLNLFCG